MSGPTRFLFMGEQEETIDRGRVYDGTGSETCSYCGKPARARITVTTSVGDTPWVWATGGTCEERVSVPIRVILDDHAAEEREKDGQR